MTANLGTKTDSKRCLSVTQMPNYWKTFHDFGAKGKGAKDPPCILDKLYFKQFLFSSSSRSAWLEIPSPKENGPNLDFSFHPRVDVRANFSF